MKYLISTGTAHYLHEFPSLTAACKSVSQKYPGGKWSRCGTREYLELEREYILDDEIIFVSTLDGIKQSVIDSAACWSI